ncbi:TonB-dependent receptor plug domain-containing protein [Mucilaginibacter sp. 21P]|uniref:MG2 domain-containing protein n=1 Tax=Mucilaginibacter sp. 21P TaxID=2778902 RepID=UPI001C5825B9|nr:MG2 domain-containing protein [Mucilaginibacter sp. 21P]QXV66600.1 TonB-dependent receptor plug domain-containing protein [Mucilaginibacter sp. 21P]
MRQTLLCVYSLLGFVLPLSAQVASSPANADEFVQNLKAAAANSFIEKAYLHFDRACYNAGDTMYFKAYLTTGEKHEPSKVSGVLHVDLISDRDSIIQSILLQTQNGTAAGDFALPAYFQKGNYRVRAYTNWMRNYRDNNFFYRTIPVNSTISAAKPQNAGGKPDMQFFAEAGVFVAGIPTRFAFKAVADNGLGIDVHGVVVDNNDVVVAKLRSAHLGMGQFYLTAIAGKTYRAKLNFADGSSSTVDLLKPVANGIAMTVNNSDSAKFSVDINTTKAYYLENKNKNISVVISAAGIVKTVKTALDNQIIGFDMPKKDFPSGLTTVILFGPDEMEVGERMLFINGNDGLNIDLRTDKQIYQSGEKVTLNVNVKQNTGSSERGSFSAAVVNEDEDPCKDMATDNILSYLLLSSDIRGYIEQPGYYFEKNNADTRNNLDLFLLTQGYKGLVKTQIEKPAANNYQPESNLQLKGKLATKAGKPIANEKVSVLTDANQSAQATTDKDGNFVFDNVSFNNGSKFIFNVENKSIRKNAMVTIEKTYNPAPVSPTREPVQVVDRSNYSSTGNNVAVNLAMSKPGKRKAGASYHTTSLIGAGNADQVVFRKDIPSATSLSQGLQNIIRGVDFINGQAFLRTGGVVANGNYVREPMMVVVDGLLGQGGSIDNVMIQDVDNIEILKGTNAAIYGMGAGAGVIIINTRQGAEAEPISQEMAPGIISVTPQGYYNARSFYNPVYQPSFAINKSKRPTILWKSNIATDSGGGASFSFNNAVPGNYRVILEGINNNGRLGRVVYRYTVK